MMVQDAEILLRLREEREQRADLARTLDLHLALLAARAEVAARVPADWPEHAWSRLQQGEPALCLDELELDWEAVVRLARTVCHILARQEPARSPALARIASRFDEAALSPKGVQALVVRYLADHDGGGLPEPGVDPALFGFVLNQALHPFLQAYAAVAAPLLEQERWLRGRCPVCGGHPDFAALEGEVGERRLLCARCDSEWAYRRLGCPFCGNEDPGGLGYFPTGDGAYRLYVCEQCKGYLKTVDLRETWRRRSLPVERILTVGMDLAAAEQGYRRATGSRPD
ncbi:MAG: formate dehydrogenase accessory protein FdhE [Deltaproteobacteria bacterium]|nr:formate dehydrogenase accessory protein FdhE [Deltaproteobacteria bacterium]